MASKRTLRIGIIDLVTKGPTRALWARVMNANLAGIMPQVVAVWCEEEGHSVTYVCYTGFENLVEELPEDIDLVFIGAFTESAQMAYALSAIFRSRGAVTVLGGPHARCYPEDARHYFDYVTGFTDKEVIREILDDCSRHRPYGRYLAATQQPTALPGVRERWKFIEHTLRKAPVFKIVPMLGSLGCPYTCSFCIDSVVPYQPLDFEVMKEDLSVPPDEVQTAARRLARSELRHPLRRLHGRHRGRRSRPTASTSSPRAACRCCRSRTSKRLRRNGFNAMLPGIESWYTWGKVEDRPMTGMEKVRHVSDQVNMIMRYVPYVQTNFVLGMDTDEGPEPFELTKRFLDMTPGAFPAYSLLSSFGQAAPLNLEYQSADRVIPFPFHFLNNNQAMNVRPMNYSWPEFYENVIDLSRHSFSSKAIVDRFAASSGFVPRWLNVVRAMSSEGYGRIRYNTEVLGNCVTTRGFRSYFEQESDSSRLFTPIR